VGLAFFIGVLGVIVYSSMNLRQFRVAVCMTYEGRTECRAASGTTREEAIRSAVDNACTTIAPGMSNFRLCETSAPASVRDVK
jgi:hypothetical protein